MVMSQRPVFLLIRHFSQTFDLDGSILQRLEGRNERLDEIFVCFLYIEVLHEES